jgi:hypothetical protein
MIRRRAGDEILLIRQTDHAHLAAQLATAVGNARFAPAITRGPVLQAIELHDAGWPLHDDHPAINARGEPTDVFEMPPIDAMAIWSASTLKAAAIDPYVGLLVSLHGLALSLHVKLEKTSDRAEIFSLIKFQHAQIELQEDLRRQLNMPTGLPLQNGLAELGTTSEEDLLLANFSLLQFADQLSLNLCFDECRFPDIDLVPKSGKPAIRLTVIRSQTGFFSLNPWPFGQQDIRLTLPAQKIPARRYADNNDLHRAFEAAQHLTLSIELEPTGRTHPES